MDGLHLILAKRGKGWQAIANRRKVGLCQGSWAALRLLLATTVLTSCHLSNICLLSCKSGVHPILRLRDGARVISLYQP